MRTSLQRVCSAICAAARTVALSVSKMDMTRAVCQPSVSRWKEEMLERYARPWINTTSQSALVTSTHGDWLSILILPTLAVWYGYRSPTTTRSTKWMNWWPRLGKFWGELVTLGQASRCYKYTLKKLIIERIYGCHQSETTGRLDRGLHLLLSRHHL